MYKMKEICELSGLTERAVRLYIEQELIKLETRDGAHNKAYFFDEEDVETLKNTSTCRCLYVSYVRLIILLFYLVIKKSSM